MTFLALVMGGFASPVALADTTVSLGTLQGANVVLMATGDTALRSSIRIAATSSTLITVTRQDTGTHTAALVAGSGCAQQSVNEVRCTISGEHTVYGSMGTNADKVVLVGIAAASLSGGDGADILQGGSGPDTLYGNGGSDVLEGAGGVDYLFGGDGGDTLSGGADNDLLIGGTGPDDLNGDDGTEDVAVYANETGQGRNPWDTSRTAGISVTLDGAPNDGSSADDSASGRLDNVTDTMEWVWGTRFGDTLTGSDRAGELLNGWSGNDVLDARGGDDRLLGDSGDDVLVADDGVKDSEVNCDNSAIGVVPGADDVAAIDSVDRPFTSSCETVNETGGSPGGGTGGGAGGGGSTGGTTGGGASAGAGAGAPVLGSAPSDCANSIAIGPLKITGSSCMDRKGLTWTARGEVTVAGLAFVPNSGTSTLKVDLFNLSISASGGWDVYLKGSFGDRQLGPIKVFSGAQFVWSFQWTPRLQDAPGVFQAIQSGPGIAMSTLTKLPGLITAPTLPTLAGTGMPDFSQVKEKAVAQLMASIPTLSTKQISVDLQKIGMPALPVIRVGPEGVNWSAANARGQAANARENAKVTYADQEGSLFGLPLAGAVEIAPAQAGNRYGANLTLRLRLPSLLSGVDTMVKLFIGEDGRASVSRAGVELAQVGLGPLYLKPFRVIYDWTSDTWEGATATYFGVDPEMGFGGSVKVSKGVLREVSIETAGIPAPLGPTAVFDYLGGSLTFDPLRGSASASVGFGPKVPVLETKMFSVNGTVTYDSSAASISMEGGADVAGARMFDAAITYWFSGRVDASGRVARYVDAQKLYGFEGVISGEASLKGANLSGTVDFKANSIVLGGDGLISTVGVAACARARTGFSDVKLGAGYRWRDTGITWLGASCDFGPFKARVSSERPGAAREMASAPHTVSVGAGQKALVMQIRGASAPPRVQITGPGGVVVESPGSNAPTEGNGYILIPQPADNSTYVAIARPAKGTWTITPLDGADIAPPMVAAQLPPARVTGVLAKGRLTFTASKIAGQVIRFTESGREVSRDLGSTTRATGSIGFTPAAGPGGPRKIIATVEQDGLPRAQFTVARFRARPPVLAKPRVRAVRGTAGGATVTWSRVRGAKQYEVLASYNGYPYTYRMSASQRSLPLPDVLRRSSLSVRVRALAVHPRVGPWGTAQMAKPKAVRIAAKKARPGRR